MSSAFHFRSSPELSFATQVRSACSGKATRRTAAAWKSPQHSAKCSGVASDTSQSSCDAASWLSARAKLQSRRALGRHPARIMCRMER
eukprot:2820447-Rhodomonas_salina.1